MPVIDIKSYKLAKKFSEDSKNILQVIDLAERALINFKHYKPVLDLIAELGNSRSILKAHLQKAEKILTQGKNSNEKK